MQDKSHSFRILRLATTRTAIVHVQTKSKRLFSAPRLLGRLESTYWSVLELTCVALRTYPGGGAPKPGGGIPGKPRPKPGGGPGMPGGINGIGGRPMGGAPTSILVNKSYILKMRGLTHWGHHAHSTSSRHSTSRTSRKLQRASQYVDLYA